MVLADRTLFIAGVPDTVNEDEAQQTISLPDTRKRLAEFAAALHGQRGALLHAVSADNGEVLTEHQLDALPVSMFRKPWGWRARRTRRANAEVRAYGRLPRLATGCA